MAQLELHLFGFPRLYLEGRRVEIGLHKALALLAYLAVTKRAHSREALATLLWPDADQSKALGRLRRTLYQVGQAVGSEIVRANRTMAELDPQAQLRVDIDHFQDLVTGCLPESGPDPIPDAACATRLTQAVDLYADGFMAGFTLPDSPPFDEWQFFEAESLRRSYGQALEQLVDGCQARAEWQEATEYARRLLALDPLDETAHRRLMRLYALAGQQRAALRQYGECARILEEELGIAPEEETLTLYEAIKSRQLPAVIESARAPVREQVVGSRTVPGSASTDGQGNRGSGLHEASDARKLWLGFRDREDGGDGAGPPGSLPAPMHPLVGRERELGEIRTLLADKPDTRLLVIAGPGGIGKTRLALEAARQTRHVFGDGIYFVRLGRLSSADQLLLALAEKTGLRPRGGPASDEQLLGYLSGKRLLLLLDNFERVMDGAGLLAEILKAAPEVKILVTSHQRLNLSGESVYALGGMPFPDAGSCRDALEYEAVQLLVHLGRLARPHLELTPDDICQAARICRLVGGTPLALVLAAGWLEMLSYEEIADEIAHNLDFLQSPLVDLPERQRSVRAAFEYSWNQLTKADQRAFMRLSVFEDGFGRPAAQRVAGVEPRTLRRLIDKSLVSVRGEDRYEIHEVLYQYAAQRLEASGEAEQVHDRHAEHYLAMACQREADLKGRRQIQALDEIEQDLANIHAAWMWAVQQKNEAALGWAAESLYLFFSFRGRYQEGAGLFQAAYERLAPCPEDEPSLDCSRLLARLSWLQLVSPDRPAGIRHTLTRHLALSQRRGDRTEEAFSLLQLGCYHLLAERQSAVAIDFLEQSLEKYQAVGDRFYTAAALHWLGVAQGFAGSLEHLMDLLGQSLSLARETGNRVLVPYNLRALAVGALCLGDYGAAERFCQEALEIDGAVGATSGLAESRILLGLARLLQGDLERSRALAGEALELARRVDRPATMAHGLAVQSLLLSLGGQAAQGQQMGAKALAMHATTLGAVLANWALAVAHYELEQDDVAWAHLQEGMRHAHRLGLQAMEAWLLPVAALILDRHGQTVQSVEMLSLAQAHRQYVAGWTDGWARFTALQTHQKAELGAELYEAAAERGQLREVEEAATWILEGFGRLDGAEA